MRLKFHRGGVLLGAVFGFLAGLLMIYLILETPVEEGKYDLVLPAFFLWLIIPVLLWKAFHREGGDEEE